MLQLGALAVLVFAASRGHWPLAANLRLRARTTRAPTRAARRATLVDHLEQIVRYCRGHGAEPILLTRPFHDDAVEKAQRTAARETGAALVDVTGRFDRLLVKHPREESFVLDGRCNDVGHRSIAEELARTLRRYPPDSALAPVSAVQRATSRAAAATSSAMKP